VDHRAKLARARQHLDQLDPLIRSFSKNSIRIVEKKDVEKKEKILCMEWDPIPPEWLVMIGDCLFNLRASLDQLVYALAVANQGSRPESTKLSFPIFGSQTAFDDKRRGLNCIDGINEDAKRDIIALQPFNARQGPDAAEYHPLFRLNRLHNVDKHRHLSLVALAVSGMKWEADSRNYVPTPLTQHLLSPIWTPDEPASVLKSRTELLRVAIPPDREPYVKVDVSTGVGIADAKLPGQVFVRTFLHSVHNHIRDVVFIGLERHLP
jgi:hypothetical protein